MASQSGHAATKLMMSRVSNNFDQPVLDLRAVYRIADFVENPDLGVAFAPQVLVEKDDSSIKVIDNGLTEFHGEKTLTCSVKGIFEQMRPDLFTDAEGVADENFRQYMFFSSSSKKPVKLDICWASFYGSFVQLASDLGCRKGVMEVRIRDLEPRVLGWLRSGYGKIALNAETSENLNQIALRLKDLGMKFTKFERNSVQCIVVSPYPSKMFTTFSGLKLI